MQPLTVEVRPNGQEHLSGPSSPDLIGSPKLSVHELCVRYRERQVLGPVTLRFERNRVTALIGPSGCGKTTLLRALNRMHDSSRGCRITGDVRLDGRSLYNRPVDGPLLRQRIGMIFQSANPFPKSIFENVAYGLRLNGNLRKLAIAEEVERALRQTALWDEVKDRLHDNALGLSGGQQQRLCVARALVLKPEVLLMDEPAAALDPISTAHIEELIGELVQACTIVIVTHNLQQAARICHYAAFFYLGELVEFGERAQIFERPRDRRTADYVSGAFG